MFKKLCGCCVKDTKKKKHRREMPEESAFEGNVPYKTFSFTEKGHGKKKTDCQDTACIMEDFYKGMTFLAVYDGHGQNGRTASDLANKGVREYIVNNKETLYGLDTEEDMEKFFRKMCSSVQSMFQSDKTDYELSGTCAVMVLVKEDMIYTANLGDSRAVIGSCSKDETCALEVSIDHKPTREKEKERIINSGGKIEKTVVDDKEVGPYRVWKAEEDIPGIAISRSFGDLVAHKIGVSAEPEVTAKEIDGDDKFLVMGSDGVWDVMSSAEAVGFILSLSITEKETAAEKMVIECRERWDLLNEIKKKQAQIYLDSAETNKKAAAEKKLELERNITRDDITVALHYLIPSE